MERLINDLLDMASINAGKLAIQPAEVDARELASEVLDSHEPAAHDRGITIARDIDDGGVRFTFADTGPGIAASDLPHILGPYRSSRSGRKKGTGLGLFITRAIIEAHGGTIRVDSSPGGGASFSATLPIGDVGIAPATTDP
jgi:signal transduction histidine kinase